MSLVAINENQRKLQSRQQQIQFLDHRLINLQSTHQEEVIKNKKINEILDKKMLDIKNLTRDIQSKDKLIIQLKEKINNQQKAFKELFDNCHCLESLSLRQGSLISQGHKLQLQIQNIKRSAQQQQIRSLEKMLQDKREVIKKVLIENRQLKESILNITHQHHLQKIQLNNKISSSYSKQTFEKAVPSQIKIEKITSDYVLQMKNAQIQDLKIKIKKQSQTKWQLIDRNKELQRELKIARRQYMPLQFEEAFDTNTRLIQQNKYLKSQIQQFDRTQLQQLKQKINSYVLQGKTLQTLQQIILKLQRQNLENLSKSQDYIIRQNKNLQNNEKQLIQKCQKYEFLLNKYNKFYKMINPHFETYKYGLLDIEKTALKVLDQVQLMHCNDFALKKDTLMSKQRDINFREEKVKTQNQNALFNIQQKLKELITLFNQQNETLSVLCKSQHFEKAIQKGEQKLNQLLNTLNQYKNKQAIWQGEKRYLTEQIKFQKLQNVNKYIFESKPKFIELDSIVLSNNQSLQQSKTIPNGLKQIEEKVNKWNQQIFGLIEDHRRYLTRIDANNLLIKDNTKLYLQLKAQYERTVKQNQQKDIALTKIEQQLEKKQKQIKQKQSHEFHPSQVFDPVLSLPTNSDINNELIKQLTNVLNHNDNITQQLLSELQVVKNQYQRLEQSSHHSQQISQQIVQENNILKIKLTQAIIQIETASDREKQIAQQINLLRNQNQRLNKALYQAELHGNLNLQKVNSQFQKLQMTVNSNIISSLSGEKTQIDPNSSSLISIVELLKQLVNQKNEEIIYLQDKLKIHQENGNHEKHYSNIELSTILEKAIDVITQYKQQQ